jgi:hypothetical protein
MDAFHDPGVVGNARAWAREVAPPPLDVTGLPVEYGVDEAGAGDGVESVGIREEAYLRGLRDGGRRFGFGGDTPGPRYILPRQYEVSQRS